jgi:hypothetical protein
VQVSEDIRDVHGIEGMKGTNWIITGTVITDPLPVTTLDYAGEEKHCYQDQALRKMHRCNIIQADSC